MNSLVVLFVVFAVASADPDPKAEPKPDHVVAVNQDSLGNYNIRYAVDDISRVEQRSVLRTVNDDFVFIDGHGILRRADLIPSVHTVAQLSPSVHTVNAEIPLVVRDIPEVAVLRTAEVAPTRLVSEVLEVPVGISTTNAQILPEVPLVRSVPVASAPVVHVAETPAVLEVGASKLAAHVARSQPSRILI